MSTALRQAPHSLAHEPTGPSSQPTPFSHIRRAPGPTPDRRARRLESALYGAYSGNEDNDSIPTTRCPASYSMVSMRNAWQEGLDRWDDMLRSQMTGLYGYRTASKYVSTEGQWGASYIARTALGKKQFEALRSDVLSKSQASGDMTASIKLWDEDIPRYIQQVNFKGRFKADELHGLHDHVRKLVPDVQTKELDVFRLEREHDYVSEAWKETISLAKTALTSLQHDGARGDEMMNSFIPRSFRSSDRQRSKPDAHTWITGCNGALVLLAASAIAGALAYTYGSAASDHTGEHPLHE